MAVLSWTAPADDGGAPVIGYDVFRRVGSGPESLLDSTAATETIYLDGGVTNGVSYTYRVGARNTAGLGALSNPVTVVPAGTASAPSEPLGLSASKVKGNTSAIDLTWSAPASDGGSPISAYFVYRRGPTDADYVFLATSADGSTTSYRDTTTASRTTYGYHVTAWNAYGPSQPSSEVSIRSK